MVDRGTRNKSKIYRKTPGGKTTILRTRHKVSKAQCAITGKGLSGTTNQSKSSIGKLSKTSRRPSVAFGGVLSSKARREVWENFALVAGGRKKIEDVPTTIRKYVKQARGD
ncbi:MAG: hypothetical protein NUV67_00330 [archaeon]|nr:hypothetical protein [archaeon]